MTRDRHHPTFQLKLDLKSTSTILIIEKYENVIKNNCTNRSTQRECSNNVFVWLNSSLKYLWFVFLQRFLFSSFYHLILFHYYYYFVCLFFSESFWRRWCWVQRVRWARWVRSVAFGDGERDDLCTVSFTSDQIMTVGYCGAVVVGTFLRLATAAGDRVGSPIVGARMGRTRGSADYQIIQSAHRSGPVASFLLGNISNKQPIRFIYY